MKFLPFFLPLVLLLSALRAECTTAGKPFRSVKEDFEVIEISPGANLYYHIAEGGSTTGLVFIIHPRGASAATWMESVMMIDTMKVLFTLGYSIAAPDSFIRGFPTPPFYPVWSLQPYTSVTWENNGDVSNFRASLSHLAAEAAFDANTPIYAMGMSQGCDAIPLLGTVINLSAAACQSGCGWSVGEDAVFDQNFHSTGIPTFFTLGTNATGGDGTNDDRPGKQRDAIRDLELKNIPVNQMRIPVTKPVEAGDFLRIPGFTVYDGIELLDHLRTTGCLDADDYQYGSPPWDNGCQDYGRFNTPADVRSNVESVLRCTFGGNCMAVDYDAYLISWFKDNQARIGTPGPPGPLSL